MPEHSVQGKPLGPVPLSPPPPRELALLPMCSPIPFPFGDYVLSPPLYCISGNLSLVPPFPPSPLRNYKFSSSWEFVPPPGGFPPPFHGIFGVLPPPPTPGSSFPPPSSGQVACPFASHAGIVAIARSVRDLHVLAVRVVPGMPIKWRTSGWRESTASRGLQML
jgi:hypothetical protein